MDAQRVSAVNAKEFYNTGVVPQKFVDGLQASLTKDLNVSELTVSVIGYENKEVHFAITAFANRQKTKLCFGLQKDGSFYVVRAHQQRSLYPSNDTASMERLQTKLKARIQKGLKIDPVSMALTPR